MACGDAGHILLSRHVRRRSRRYGQWRPFLHDLGFCEVKHGVKLQIVNLCTEGSWQQRVASQNFGRKDKAFARKRWIH